VSEDNYASLHEIPAKTTTHLGERGYLPDFISSRRTPSQDATPRWSEDREWDRATSTDKREPDHRLTTTASTSAGTAVDDRDRVRRIRMGGRGREREYYVKGPLGVERVECTIERNDEDDDVLGGQRDDYII